jgi:hypothetical protein
VPRVGRVCLGIDPQTTRLGLAACLLDDEPTAVWAETFPLRGPGATLGGHVRAAVRLAERRLDGLEVGRVAIERGTVFKATHDYLWDAGGVYHLALDACLRRFGRIALVPLRVTQWKAAALGNGRAGKGAIAIWARERATEAGWPDYRLAALADQDSCDALGIAVAGISEGGPP